MSKTKDTLLGKIRNGEPMSLREQAVLTLTLSIPAILAQVSTVMMSYIDTAMVGRLGANASASIGLISTSTWLVGGLSMAACSGFSVQIAHLMGSREYSSARNVFRKGLISVLVFSLLLAAASIAVSGPLPRWLGGGEDICADASAYLMIYAAFLPLMQVGWLSGSALQASGNMKVPSVLNIMMCVLDVLFNYVFIFVCGMGVRGAALGTGCAEAVTALAMLGFLARKSPELRLDQERGRFLPDRECLRTAFGISGPMWIQNIVMKGAYMASTVIVAPLGNIAIAANSFAITAESFCYMPGYGVSEATTSLVGQSLGAGRKPLAKRFTWISIGMGAFMMTVCAVAMFFGAESIMAMLSTDPDVVALGAKCLRLEAFAETLYGVSIVAYGACVGAGDTLVPSAMNLVSMWIIRIGLALFLTPTMGLMGYWIAMCIELNVRGALFLYRVRGDRWMKFKLKTS